MRRRAFPVAGLVAAAIAFPVSGHAQVTAAQTGTPRSALQAPPAMKGHAPPYVAPADMPDLTAILPLPPSAGSASQASDDAIFRATRALAGTPRFALAARDARLDAPSLVADFDCAVGATLTNADMPAFFRILDRAKEDAAIAYDRPKKAYQRVRPFVGNDLPICVPRDPRLAASGSYPSGHTTIGDAVALLLAAIAPDRATAILARGRVYGESRVVCGVHWASDVAAGYLTASALVASLEGSADFRADLDQARVELRAARAAGPAPSAAACHDEEDAARHSVLFTAAPHPP